MNTRSYRLWAILAAALVMLSCSPLTVTSLPTQVPGAINTYVVQTAAVLTTQTAAAIPTATPVTPTLQASDTPIPRTETSTPKATPTITLFWIMPTLTPSITFVLTVPSSGGGGGGGGSVGVTGTPSGLQCSVLSQTPANGARYKPKKEFDVVWKVQNTGTRIWDPTIVSYVYASGDKLSPNEYYPLTAYVKQGETINIFVDMTAPKLPGTYTTTWKLTGNNKTLCTFSITIRVSN